MFHFYFLSNKNIKQYGFAHFLLNKYLLWSTEITTIQITHLINVQYTAQEEHSILEILQFAELKWIAHTGWYT